MTVKNLAIGQTVKITVSEGNGKSGDPYTLTTENLTESNGSYTVTANGDITIKVAEDGTKDYYFGTVVVNVK